MNVTLDKDLEELIAREMRTGRYGSEKEVVRAGLMLLEARDLDATAKGTALREAVQAGRDSGDPIDGREVFAELRRRQATLESNKGE